MVKNGRDTSAKRLDSSDIIAIAACVTSIIAFGFAVWQGSELRHHNRLSLAPWLSFAFADHNDSEFYGILIRNEGVGPARFTKVRVFVDGKFVGTATNPEWRKILLAVNVPDIPAVATTEVLGDALLQAGKAIRIFGALHKNLTAELKGQIGQARNRLQFSICFCSLYDQCRPKLSPHLRDEPCIN